MNYWLMKTEPGCFSIDDLEEKKRAAWDGVRNYQARNFINSMKVGDLVLFYHSNAKPSGVAGLAKVCAKAYPDHTALDPKEKHYDPKASQDRPIWTMVDVCFVKKFNTVVALELLRETKGLEDMILLQKGCRLSIMPVTSAHFSIIEKMGERDGK